MFRRPQSLLRSAWPLGASDTIASTYNLRQLLLVSRSFLSSFNHPRRDELRIALSPPRTCSSSQATDDPNGILSGIGREYLLDGLERYPGPDSFPGSFDVFDYWGGVGPEGAAEGISFSDAPSGALVEEARGNEEEDLLDTPVLGRFPISNWLSDKLSATRDNTESHSSVAQLAEPLNAAFNHYDIDPYQNIGLDLDISSSLSSRNFVDPATGLTTLRPENQSAQRSDVHLEQSISQRPTQLGFTCGICGASLSSQGKLK
ncbi:uncharacterized protein F4822DRAFT_439860 [Hypoxylon trugodes]|uniref:uncharacterized protein n=1 Tax=Hypoxylon trugodes TaxID=326681 RepID=UPI0021998A3D|nr:uncharacterized protein F4822DRAFT_439860 [Hypoxylon trugodes]KAI1394148.1 hypothetical protein F4822DRAFT_439860 [Hypoxylon trugodes]